MSEEAQALADAAKLPLDERVAHSNWKARSAAYEAIKAGCNSVFDSEDPILLEYGERNFLGVAQSWGLHAVQLLLYYCSGCTPFVSLEHHAIRLCGHKGTAVTFCAMQLGSFQRQPQMATQQRWTRPWKLCRPFWRRHLRVLQPGLRDQSAATS